MRKSLILPILYGVTIVSFLFALFFGNQTVTAMVETSPIYRHRVLVIDAGHGGVDGGATSCTGQPESALNLEISLRLRDLFHLLGHETRMIRTADVSVYTKGDSIAQKKISDLKERVRMVNETENALLLSIHQNNFSDSRYSGAQVFYGRKESGEALARSLQSAFAASLNPGSRRLSKQSQGVYLMDHIDCAGVLIECGFLSNPIEEANLRTPAYQKKLCCVIAATVSTFLSNT